MKIKAGKVVPVHVTKPHRGSRGIAPLILNLGNRWGSAVSFMLHLLHPHGKISGYQLNRCGLTQGLVWTFWRREKSLARPRIQTPDHPVH